MLGQHSMLPSIWKLPWPLSNLCQFYIRWKIEIRHSSMCFCGQTLFSLLSLSLTFWQETIFEQNDVYFSFTCAHSLELGVSCRSDGWFRVKVASSVLRNAWMQWNTKVLENIALFQVHLFTATCPLKFFGRGWITEHVFRDYSGYGRLCSLHK